MIIFSDYSPRPQPLLQPDICNGHPEVRHEGDAVIQPLIIHDQRYCFSGYLRGVGSDGPGQALRLCGDGQNHDHIEGICAGKGLKYFTNKLLRKQSRLWRILSSFPLTVLLSLTKR